MAERIDALASFVAKWRQRQPEMVLLDSFAPAAERPLLTAWGALNNELMLTMFESSDASVSRTKLAWWGDDLAAGTSGARHPIARALFVADAPREVSANAWRQLALAAIALADAVRDTPGPQLPEHAVARFSEQLASVETIVLAARSDAMAIDASIRLEHVLRRNDDAAVVTTIAAQILAAAPSRPALNWFRNVQLAIDCWLLTRLASGVPVATLTRPPGWRALLLTWSASRRSLHARNGS